MNENQILRAHEVPLQEIPDNSPVLLTIPEAARKLRCSKTHVHNLIYGKVPDVPPLPVLRIGRRVLIRHEGLKAWMLAVEAHEMEAQRLTGFFSRK
jgi:excisionase family DNA binding protein